MGKKNERIEREVKLINAVHGVSRLWQKSDEKYADQNSKGPIWSKLAKECGFEDGKEAAAVWKKLRKQYVDRLNKKKASTGSGLDDVLMDADDSKYAMELDFLRPETDDRPSRSTLDKQPSTDNDGDDPEYVESEEEDDDEEDDEERGKRTQSRKSSGKSPRSSMSSFSASQAPSKAGSQDLFKRPSSVKGGKKRRTARDEVEQELLSIIRAPDDDDDEALCGRQVTNFLRRLPPMKRRPAIIEMQQLMFRFEYDAQLVYETATQQELPPHQEQEQQAGTSASFAKSAADAWAMDGAAIDENSMEALNGDPMFSSTASNSN